MNEMDKFKQGMLYDVEEKIKEWELLRAKIQAAKNIDDLKKVTSHLKTKEVT